MQLQFARTAVILAVAVTVWFNGTYAWSKAQDLVGGLGLIAMAVTIDFAKCSLLPFAALSAHAGAYLRATIIVVLLWLPAMMFSMFCAYSAIITNRTHATTVTDARQGDRQRVQARYDRALADLTAAKASPVFTATNACTTLTLPIHRSTCAAIDRLTAEVNTLATTLGPTAIPRVDPEVAALTQIYPGATSAIILAASALPALILELVASLGGYVLSPLPVRATPPKAPQSASGTISEPKERPWGYGATSRSKSAPAPATAPAASKSASAPQASPPLAPSAPPRPIVSKRP